MINKILAAAVTTTIMTASPARASWVEASSEHFLVIGDMPAEQAKNWAIKLERLDRLLRLASNTPEMEGSKLSRVTVYVVPDMASVQKLYGGKNKDVGGFYNASAQGSIAITPRLLPDYLTEFTSPQEILFHEYTHHIMLSSTTGFYPDWVQEGMAEYFSTAKQQPDGTTILGTPPLDRGFALMGNYQITVPELLTVSERSRNQDDVQHLYARGWLLTHLLMSKQDRAGQLSKYLSLLDNGMESVQAGRAAFGNLGKLDSELVSYVHSANFKGIYVPAAKLTIGPVVVRALSPCEARIMPVRLISANGVSEKSAGAVAASARKVSETCADNAFVQRTMAETEFDAKNNEASAAASKKTLQLDPQNLMAMVYSGRVAARQAKWEDARKWFVMANHVEPNFALPLVLYSDTYTRAGQPMPAAAIEGLMRAVVLVPQDASVRMRVGRALIKEGDLKTAKAVILPVAHAPDGKGDSTASKLITLIDTGAKPAAVLAEADKAKWNKIGDE